MDLVAAPPTFPARLHIVHTDYECSITVELAYLEPVSISIDMLAEYLSFPGAFDVDPVASLFPHHLQYPTHQIPSAELALNILARRSVYIQTAHTNIVSVKTYT